MDDQSRSRTVILLRHGKSSWSDSTLADIDRPLAPRGERASRKLAKYIRRKRIVREAALAAAAASASEPDELLAGASVFENSQQVRKSADAVMARVWGGPAAWRDRGVDPADGHAHTNVKQGQPLSSWPGSPVTEYSRPPIPPPSGDVGDAG